MDERMSVYECFWHIFLIATATVEITVTHTHAHAHTRVKVYLGLHHLGMSDELPTLASPFYSTHRWRHSAQTQHRAKPCFTTVAGNVCILVVESEQLSYFIVSFNDLYSYANVRADTVYRIGLDLEL